MMLYFAAAFYFINKIMGGTKMGKHKKAPKAL